MSLADDLIFELSSIIDGSGYAGYLDDRFFPQLLERTGDRATPDAFEVEGTPKVSIVILEPELLPHSQSFQIPNATAGIVTVWIYGPDNDTGWSEVNTLRDAVYSAFQDHDFHTVNEDHFFLIWSGDLPTRRNNEDLQNSIVSNVRFSATFTRRKVPLS